jgi:circadian clock protein KaiB
VAERTGTPHDATSRSRVAAAPQVQRLRLYTAGQLPNSLQAEQHLRELCAAHLPGRHTVEVIDVLASPQRGLDDGIIATPTLVRLEPAPRVVIVGNLRDGGAVLRALGLEEQP